MQREAFSSMHCQHLKFSRHFIVDLIAGRADGQGIGSVNCDKAATVKCSVMVLDHDNLLLGKSGQFRL
jgi:hypothetical protein